MNRKYVTSLLASYFSVKYSYNIDNNINIRHNQYIKINKSIELWYSTIIKIELLLYAFLLT